jgi:hypothetical protein
MFRNTGLATCLPSAIIALAVLLAIRSAAAAEPTPVEHVTSNPPGPTDALATMVYGPSDKERPFFEKLAPAEIKTGGLAGDYDITKRAGRYVGWFGVVRLIEEDASSQQTMLTIEHKYFDGLTDAHIQALSFNGSGDFLAALNGPGHEIPLLSLVKVYGIVAITAVDGLPRVEAQFVRVWHWGTFTFLDDWGDQRGSQRWRQLNQVALDDIYEPYPSRVYYEQRLGRLAGGRGPAIRRPRRVALPDILTRAQRAAINCDSRIDVSDCFDDL